TVDFLELAPAPALFCRLLLEQVLAAELPRVPGRKPAGGGDAGQDAGLAAFRRLAAQRMVWGLHRGLRVFLASQFAGEQHGGQLAERARHAMVLLEGAAASRL
ncbi:hypothetical protein HK405_010121, partial [Cladochytrium tenue]